jgi:hypothetical protein
MLSGKGVLTSISLHCEMQLGTILTEAHRYLVSDRTVSKIMPSILLIYALASLLFTEELCLFIGHAFPFIS